MLDRFFAPLWQTPMALLEVLGLAQLGTAIVGLFLFLAALELLRSSSGAIALFARTVAVGAGAFVSAALIYGDFMAPTAMAVYTRIASRVPEDQTSAVLAATFGAATAGVALSSSRKSAGAPPKRTREHAEIQSRLDVALVLAAVDPARVAALGKLRVLDAASRIQLRLLTNRPAKTEEKKVPRGRGLPRGGAPAFWRVRRV
jgi:hypothetical protein